MSNTTLMVSTAYYFIFFDSRKYIKLGIVILLLLTALYDMALGGRSFVVLLLISVGTSIIVNIVYSHQLYITRRISYRDFLFFILILAAALYLYYVNRDLISSLFRDSYMFHRFFSESGQDLFYDARSLRRNDYLLTMRDHMFGGRELFAINKGYGHDIFLDIFDVGGIIPFMIFSVYMFRSLTRLIALLLNRYIYPGYKIIIVSYASCVIAQFFIEPMLSSAPSVVMSYCMIDGAISSFIKKSEEYVNEGVHAR
jgi:hypothetical protein